MGRRKLKMELISKVKTRLVTYDKRKQCLMRKAYEFSTLCDVETCVILYGPKLQYVAQDIETWPKNHEQVCAVIDGYRSTKHSDARGKRNQGVEDFYTDPMKKLQDEFVKVRKENMELRFLKWDSRLELFSHHQLGLVETELEYKLELAKQQLLGMLRSQQRLTMSFQRLPPLADFDNHHHMYSFQPRNDTQLQQSYDQVLNAVPFGYPSNYFSSMLSQKNDDLLQFPSEYYSPYCDQASNPIHQAGGYQYYTPGSHMGSSYGQNLQMNLDDSPRIQAPQFSAYMNAYEMDFMKRSF